jgi:site-specific recombinase XerD
MDSITNFNELMYLKNFSSSTIKMYNSSIIQCSKSIKKEPENINETDIRGYLLKNKHLSSSTKMSIINSFKTYFRLCFDRDFDHKILPRPKVEQKQPDILSIEEVQSMITNTANLKHKAIICLMYSCALRVSEVVNLKIKDIDSNNNKINIRNGKGKVDRITMLDSSLLELLRDYYREYKVKEYLFEGAKGEKYSVKSVQCIIKKAAIPFSKNISSHSMRHSCLTQLIKNGVDLRSVQKLAGHKNINTTANYIKIIDTDITQIESPLSSIILKNDNKTFSYTKK